MENGIMISLEDLAELLELRGRVQALAAYVNSDKYSVSREIVGNMLGFEVVEFEENIK